MLGLDWLGPSLGSSVRGRVGPGDSGTRGATWVREEKFPKREGEHHLQKTGDGNCSPDSSLEQECCLSRESGDHRTAIRQSLRGPQRGPPAPSVALLTLWVRSPQAQLCTDVSLSVGALWIWPLNLELLSLAWWGQAPRSDVCVWPCPTYSWSARDKSEQEQELNLSDIRWGTLNSTKAVVPMCLNTKHGNLRACCGSGFHPETRKAEGSEVSNRDI